MSNESRPFADLPAALVDEVIKQAADAGDLLLSRFRFLKQERNSYREALEANGLLQHESEFGYPPIPTTCATDGSYTIERLLSADLVASAAVAVEGLTPPSETRHWDQPHHASYVAVETHHEDTATVLRSLMLGRELLLAISAPHDLVMIDGTLTLPIIYLNQALSKAPKVKILNCSAEFMNKAMPFLEAYRTILKSSRSDKNFVGLPKYSTRREIGEAMRWPKEHDDRGLLTLLLRPGEITKPLRLEQPSDEWHLNISSLTKEFGDNPEIVSREIIQGLKNIYSVYYKPHSWLPALRLEVGSNIANNPSRLAVVLQGIKHQCATGSMMEPYPLYLADRTVKALARAIPTFRQVATQRISESYEGDISDVFLAMHGYRSESGV